MLIVRLFLFTFILYISLILTWLWYSYLQVGLNEVSAHTRAVLSFYLQAVSAKSSEIVAVQATWATHLTSEDFAVREGDEPRQRQRGATKEKRNDGDASTYHRRLRISPGRGLINRLKSPSVRPSVLACLRFVF